MMYATIGLVIVTACLSAQESKEPPPVSTIYANGLRGIEKDPHIAQMLIKSGRATSFVQNKDGNLEYSEEEVKNHLKKLKVDITYNEAIGRYVDFYLNIDPERLNLLFSLTQYYAGTVSANLKKQGLPKIFALIPAVCSSYGPTSTNDHGGAGPWHLNYPQGIRYKLKIGKNVDERREMDKATAAATRYLSDLYKLYNNWELALAAYTCGPAAVNKELNRQKASSFWDIYAFLPEQTRDIVPALAALAYVRDKSTAVAALNVNFDSDTLQIEKRLLFKALDAVTDADIKELTFLNPALNAEEFPSNYTAVFPVELKERFSTMKASVYTYQDSVLLYPKPEKPAEVAPTDAIAITHTVKSGEVLGIIAERYKVRVSQIQYWNDMGRSTRINVGQRLVIYNKMKPVKTAAVEEPVVETNPYDKEYITYVVKKGECLDGIAKKYPGISARNIMELNGIDDNIQAELILKIKKR